MVDPGGLEKFNAPVPFSNGNRWWTMRVRVCNDSTGRVLAFFKQAQHIVRIDNQQPTLF